MYIYIKTVKQRTKSRLAIDLREMPCKKLNPMYAQHAHNSGETTDETTDYVMSLAGLGRMRIDWPLVHHMTIHSKYGMRQVLFFLSRSVARSVRKCGSSCLRRASYLLDERQVLLRNVYSKPNYNDGCCFGLCFYDLFYSIICF